MFCKYCGNELPDGTTFCPKCGSDDTPVTTEKSDTEIKNDTTFECVLETVPKDVTKDSLASKILAFAIIGLAFACSLYLSFVGVVFSLISRSKLKKYIKNYGDTEGKATVGKHLGLVAMIVSFALSIGLIFTILDMVFGFSENIINFIDPIIFDII